MMQWRMPESHRDPTFFSSYSSNFGKNSFKEVEMALEGKELEGLYSH